MNYWANVHYGVAASVSVTASLNVAVTGALLLYEAVRQRGGRD
jgi:tRNA G18 (ribose-2'-O)-methylase SpoU